MEVKIEVDFGQVSTLDSRMRAAIGDALHRAADDSGKLVRREMRVYPAKRPNSWYVRTDVLKGSWLPHRVYVEGQAVIAEVRSSGNVAPYNVFVQKEGMQASVHRGWWPTEVTVMTNLQPHINRFYLTRIRRAVQQVNG